MSPVRGEFKQTSKLRKCGSRQDDRMSTGERAETGEVSMLLAANSDVQPGVQRWQDGDFFGETRGTGRHRKTVQKTQAGLSLKGGDLNYPKFQIDSTIL